MWKLPLDKQNQRGMSAIMIAFIVSIVLAAVGAALIYILTMETREVGYRALEKQAFYLAEAGINHAVLTLQSTLDSTYTRTQDINSTTTMLQTFNTQTLYSSIALGSGKYTVQITGVTLVPLTNSYNITFHGVGTVGTVSKSVDEIWEMGFSASRVFDNAYFINNYGWLFGGAQVFQGEVRANGDFKVQGSQKINGDVYAQGTVDESQGNFFYDSIDRYYQTAGTRSRPGDPTSLNGASYPAGYDGFADNYDTFGDARNSADPQLHPNQDPVSMPYLGDLSYYQTLATQKNGTVTIGGVTQINNVYNGTKVLTGTSSQPIVINGPVVVTGDLIIKGVVQGQGTIYAGRNVHIIDNVTYKNPPSWPKPDTNPTATDQANVGKDFLGLSSKGNVVFGDYTSSNWSQVKNYLAPPFTDPYQVSTTDASIGYVSYNQSGSPYFNGDYTASDGGTKSDSSSRKYYESSLSDSTFKSYNPSNNITQIDALLYTNHAIAGRVQNCTINGSIIGRDDAIVFSGWLTMNYDYRVRDTGKEFININLPIALQDPRRVRWSY